MVGCGRVALLGLAPWVFTTFTRRIAWDEAQERSHLRPHGLQFDATLQVAFRSHDIPCGAAIVDRYQKVKVQVLVKEQVLCKTNCL